MNILNDLNVMSSLAVGKGIRMQGGLSNGDANIQKDLMVGNDLNVMSSLAVGKGINMQKGLNDGDMNVDQNVYAKKGIVGGLLVNSNAEDAIKIKGTGADGTKVVINNQNDNFNFKILGVADDELAAINFNEPAGSMTLSNSMAGDIHFLGQGFDMMTLSYNAGDPTLVVSGKVEATDLIDTYAGKFVSGSNYAYLADTLNGYGLTTNSIYADDATFGTMRVNGDANFSGQQITIDGNFFMKNGAGTMMNCGIVGNDIKCY
jgi:hypothetical protein